MNENLISKKLQYEELAKKVTTKYRSEMKIIKGVLEVLESNSAIEKSDSLETIIFKKYLELENVQKVAKYINELGYRIKTGSWIGERKYTSNDITKILVDRDCMVERKLKYIVQFLQDKNYEHMRKIWG
ncbi:hypothetical protein [Clostridium sp.]|uniref:hypothetical protein n=1 Tax=Clostridium sp. TaxID=1506 RepID=UPI002FDE6C2A